MYTVYPMDIPRTSTDGEVISTLISCEKPADIHKPSSRAGLWTLIYELKEKNVISGSHAWVNNSHQYKGKGSRIYKFYFVSQTCTCHTWTPTATSHYLSREPAVWREPRELENADRSELFIVASRYQVATLKDLCKKASRACDPKECGAILFESLILFCLLLWYQW